jgi:hypothetical protein
MRSMPSLLTPRIGILSTFSQHREKQQRVRFFIDESSPSQPDENTSPNELQKEQEHYESTSEDEMVQIRTRTKVDMATTNILPTRTTNNDRLVITTEDSKVSLMPGGLFSSPFIDTISAIDIQPARSDEADDDVTAAESITTATTDSMSASASSNKSLMLLLLSSSFSSQTSSLTSSSSESVTSDSPYDISPEKIKAESLYSTLIATQRTDSELDLALLIHRQQRHHMPLEIVYDNDQWDIKKQWSFDDDDIMMHYSTDADDDDDGYFLKKNETILDNLINEKRDAFFDYKSVPLTSVENIGVHNSCTFHRVIHRRLNEDRCFAFCRNNSLIDDNDDEENNDFNDENEMTFWTIQHAHPIMLDDDDTVGDL